MQSPLPWSTCLFSLQDEVITSGAFTSGESALCQIGQSKTSQVHLRDFVNVLTRSRLATACKLFCDFSLVFFSAVIIIVITFSALIPFHRARIICHLFSSVVLSFCCCFLAWTGSFLSRLFLLCPVLFLFGFVSCLLKIITKTVVNFLDYIIYTVGCT